MSYYTSTRTVWYKRAWIYWTAVPTVILFSLIAWLWGDQLMRVFFTYGRGAILFTILFVLVIGAVIAAFVAFLDSYNEPKRKLVGWVSVAVALVSLTVLIFLWFRVSYDTARQYVDDVEISETASNSYSERAPQQVAVASAARNLQETVGSVGTTKSVADAGEFGQWNTLVTRPGIGVGYESIQSVDVPLFGTVATSGVTLCGFDTDKANLRIGGALPQNNLSRVIGQQTPLSVGFDSDDIYGYCDDGTPYTVVPLQEVEGFYAASWNVYGVAVYNGSTGELRILTDASDVAKIPGPTYPMSMAERQREAVNASGSYEDYFFGRTGYENTSKDGKDPNGNNNTEFQLRDNTSDETVYVTPLTARGESTTIIGTSSVNAKFLGEARNTVVISKFPTESTRAANSTVVDDLMTTYSNLTDWATGLEVFEIVPAGDGNWVASIGKSQSVLYRAEIHTDGTFILRDAKGNIIPNNDRGDGTTPVDGGTTTVNTSDLSALTPEELKQLGQDVLDELARRAK